MYICIYVPVARRPQPPPPPPMVWVHPGGGPWPPPPPQGGGSLWYGLLQCGVQRRNQVLTKCAATRLCLLPIIDPSGRCGNHGRGGLCGHTVLPFSPTPIPTGGRAGWEPWTPPTHPQGGGGLVGSHCATFLTEHDYWGGGGGGAKEAWNIYAYIYSRVFATRNILFLAKGGFSSVASSNMTAMRLWPLELESCHWSLKASPTSSAIGHSVNGTLLAENAKHGWQSQGGR